jgi:histone-lysine N-methyltransferase SETMAR
MLTVFWSPLSFSLSEILPTGIRSDSQYFCSNILFAIMQNRRSEAPEDRRRRMVLHFDNATPHTAKCTSCYLKVNRLTRAPHPASSPDLAPSDCHLFDKLEMALMGSVFAGHWKWERFTG